MVGSAIFFFTNGAGGDMLSIGYLGESAMDLFTSREAALAILKLRFSDQEIARMHELAAKNQREKLSVAESEEFDSYIKVGDLLAILQSKARKFLNGL